MLATRYQSARQTSYGTPILRLAETQRHFGEVAAGTRLEAGFTVRNEGTRRLVINEDACGGCGPGEHVPPLRVPPGETAEIRLELDTAGSRGPKRRSWDFTTNDPRLPRFSFVLAAEVVE